jgi:phosphoglycolate phosphatase
MLRGIRLVIYDLDGTLVDSTEAIVETFNIILREAGLHAPEPGVIASMIGEPMPVILRRLLPADLQGEVQRFWDIYIPVYAKISPKKTHILPSVADTLHEFKRRGKLQSIATQKRSEVASRLLGELGILDRFDLVLGINDVANPKPAPDIIELTLKRLGVEPGETVFVDDTTIGLESGKKAGTHIVGVTTGTHNREKLLSLEPDYVIDRLDELRRIIFP